MALTDLVADGLTMIRNASRAKKESVEIKRSRFMEAIVKIFKEEGFVDNYKPVDDKNQGILKVYLKYNKDKVPAIVNIRKITKSSLRVYKGYKNLPRVYGNIGIAVMSTSQGVMTADEARKKKVGGEVICYIW